MSKTVEITSNNQLTELVNTNKTVVIDFYAKLCNACKLVAPAYEQLSSALSSPGNIVFTKCEVGACQEVAIKYNITVMPTFLIFQDKAEVNRIKGANYAELSGAVSKLVAEYEKTMHGASGSEPGPSSEVGWCGAALPKGYSDVSEEIQRSSLDILNSEVGDISSLFEKSEPGKDPKAKDWVESDTDPQLMIFIPFRSIVKIHTIHLTSLPSPEGDGEEEVGRPTKIKLYANRPNIVGFDEADGITPTQEVEINPDSWDKKTGTIVINTRFVKFQSTSTLSIFVEEGEDGCEKTRIDRIKMFGDAGVNRDMGKLEKVRDMLG